MLHEIWDVTVPVSVKKIWDALVLLEPSLAFAGGVVACVDWAPVPSLGLLAPSSASPARAALLALALEPPATTTLTLDHLRGQTQYLALAVRPPCGPAALLGSGANVASSETDKPRAALQIWSFVPKFSSSVTGECFLLLFYH